MARGRRGLLDDLAVLPWPVGLSVGVLGFGLIRYGIPAWASGQPGPLAQALGKTDAFAPLAWIVLAACVVASLFSWLDSRRKRRLLDAQTGMASIPALGWRDFERLVGEAFRRQGYTVEESGPASTAGRHFHGRLLQITENSCRHRLFNGDIGICRSDDAGTLMAWSAGDDSAFAITVHKARTAVRRGVAGAARARQLCNVAAAGVHRHYLGPRCAALRNQRARNRGGVDAYRPSIVQLGLTPASTASRSTRRDSRLKGTRPCWRVRC